MSRIWMPRIFRAKASQERHARVAPKRETPRARGYDARWDRTSKRYRQQRPFCENVTAHGDLVVFGAVVDHKFPVQDGGLVHCGSDGLWHLCAACHGWKTALEDYARKNGLMSELVGWCDEPETRPTIRRGDRAFSLAALSQTTA